MRFPSSSAVLAASLSLAATSQLVQAADSEAASDVLSLTKDSFASTVDPESLMLVEFFAPWCGHCQALAPHYEEAATELKNESIKLAKVDCTVEESLCAEQDVSGYPTLKVFRKGESTPYAGPRKTDGIVSYMKKQALPAVSTLAASDIADFKTKDKVAVVAYLDESSSDSKTYTELAEKHRDSYVFGLADSKAATAEGFSVPSYVVYRTFDEPSAVYPGTGSLDSSALESFIKAEAVPLIDEIGPDNFPTYAEAGIPVAYYFTEPEDKIKEDTLEALKPLAKANKGKLNFVWIDAVKFANHAKGLNIQGEDWPAFAIQDIQAGTKYPLENLGSAPANSIQTFVDEFVSGKLSPSIKSEPIPKDQDGPVHVLVADEFDKVVFDESKDLLVEFYAPWCGHCKKLAPTYDSLGEKYKEHKDKITIAKMDATTNDVPPSAGFSVQSFPTIKFRKAGSKEFMDFNGDRTLEGFVDFIGLNAVNKVPVNLEAVNETVEEVKEAPKKAAHEEL